MDFVGFQYLYQAYQILCYQIQHIVFYLLNSFGRDLDYYL